MKKAILCVLLCVVLLVPATCFAAGEGLESAESILKNASATTFTVLHTGDVNGREAGAEDAIGYARLAALVKEKSGKMETILLDSGNALAEDGSKSIQLMEATGYTAAAIGTRDAALGIERLQELAARADFPLLCANWLRADGELLWDPYAIVQVGSIRVGVIGLVSPDIAELYPEITEGCNVYKPSGIANIYYDEMVEQGCTYFIALTSLGYDGTYTPRQLGTESPWINLILDSSTDAVLDMGELVENTNVIVFNLEPDFAQVGEIVATTGAADGMNTTLPAVYTAEDLSGTKEDEDVKALVEAEYVDPGKESSGGTVTITGGHSSMAAYIGCFAGILAATLAMIILIMSRKGAGKKKK